MFDFPDDPLEAFRAQFQLATASEIDATAMSLATVSADGTPSVRIVLLKGVDDQGFQFFTNYESQKAKEMGANRRVAIAFHWATIERQVRVAGQVERLSRAENEAYFKTRPRLSQIGAWASEQSREIPNVEWLEERVARFESEFQNRDVPCPENWGGYRIVPVLIEYWFGRANRLHHRFVYERKSPKENWRKYLKSP